MCFLFLSPSAPGSLASGGRARRFALFEANRLIVLLAILLWPVAARSADLILSRGVLEDPDGRLRIEQVVNADFKSGGSTLARGFTQSVHWVRIEVRPRPEGGPVTIRILPTVLDEIALYAPNPGTEGGWSLQFSGDRHTFGSDDRSPHSLGFRVEPQAPFSTYYLRLKTTSSSFMLVDALPPGEANRRDSLLALVQAVYLGLMIAVFVWAIRDYRLHREIVSGLFLLYQLASTLVALGLNGSFAPFESSSIRGLAGELTSLFAFMTGIFGVRFHRAMFGLFKPPRLLLRALDLVLVGFLAALVVFLSGYQHQALKISALSFIGLAVLMLVFVLSFRDQGPMRAGVLRASYTLIATSLLLSVLPAFGWVPAERWSMLGPFLHGLIASGLMASLLSRRARHFAEQVEQSRRLAERAFQELELEKRYAVEQQRFSDMLTHELKTPLGVALMSVGAMKSDNPYLHRIRRALQTINDIVDRTRLAELARHKRLQPHFALVSLSERIYECIEACSEPERVKASVGYGQEGRTDSQLFGVIVSNLIDNALKYSPPGSFVEVSLEVRSVQSVGGALVRVVNRVGSAGRPDAGLLFSKYYRSAGAHTKTGSGLGLYLSQHLAGMLGGGLCHPLEDDRVVFELWLPV